LLVLTNESAYHALAYRTDARHGGQWPVSLTWVAALLALMLCKSSEDSKETYNMRKNISLALALLSLIGLAPMLGACHTTAGVGQDLSAGGHAVTNSAEKHSP
jgi:predicted small secreted protein